MSVGMEATDSVRSKTYSALQQEKGRRFSQFLVEAKKVEVGQGGDRKTHYPPSRETPLMASFSQVMKSPLLHRSQEKQCPVG